MTEAPRRTPWRDNLEAVAAAVTLALVLKHFVVDAFRIPTGSMQPTLFGEEKLGLYDRILVDRVSTLIADPERFDVVVFRYPLDRSKNFVKRVIGVGPEELELRGGDLFRRDDASQPWTIVRKPRAVQESLLRDLDLEEPEDALFGAAPSGWSCVGRTVRADGPGVARYRPDGGTPRDSVLDGYPDAVARALEDRIHDFGHHLVSDLRLSCVVAPAEGVRSVSLELAEGDVTYRFEVPGPSAAAQAGGVRILAVPDDGRPPLTLAASTEPLRLEPGSRVELVAQNVDDLLELLVDGSWVLAAPVDPTLDPRAAVSVGLDGGGGEFTDLRVERDVYWSTDRAVTSRISVPEGHYYVLGDNSSDSSDSREWRYTRFELPPTEPDGAPRILRGNTRRGENPRVVGVGDPDGPRVRFEDEFGELHWLEPDAARRLPPEEAPFVPREAVLGRAWAVFWPWSPRYDLLRLRWVR